MALSFRVSPVWLSRRGAQRDRGMLKRGQGGGSSLSPGQLLVKDRVAGYWLIIHGQKGHFNHCFLLGSWEQGTEFPRLISLQELHPSGGCCLHHPHANKISSSPTCTGDGPHCQPHRVLLHPPPLSPGKTLTLRPRLPLPPSPHSQTGEGEPARTGLFGAG